MIKDIPSCRDLIDGIIADAEKIMQRIQRMMAAPQPELISRC